MHRFLSLTKRIKNWYWYPHFCSETTFLYKIHFHYCTYVSQNKFSSYFTNFQPDAREHGNLKLWLKELGRHAVCDSYSSCSSILRYQKQKNFFYSTQSRL
ncbi:hypothetical protein O6H91_20G051100 [Diphasiastrum complanatum]|uniref:Uncharacterized protein n=1 Tax=Diphasiastrum complanatum TaxID=34168 RepID=A0ACC2AQ85_DIPCM|nr:hypothetical protein O6H91_20G051100 [Diphasiastrum complanatum]